MNTFLSVLGPVKSLVAFEHGMKQLHACYGLTTCGLQPKDRACWEVDQLSERQSAEPSYSNSESGSESIQQNATGDET
eukprot:3299831-Amphidinium_carterae.1